MMTLMSFKLETYELYRNERTNLPYKLQTAYYSTTYTQCVWLTFYYFEFNFALCSKFVTDVIHHDYLGRRCVDKQITNLKLRELKVGQHQQEALCITQTFVIYVIFHKHT